MQMPLLKELPGRKKIGQVKNFTITTSAINTSNHNNLYKKPLTKTKKITQRLNHLDRVFPFTPAKPFGSLLNTPENLAPKPFPPSLNLENFISNREDETT